MCFATSPGCLINRDCDNLQNFIAINKSVKSHWISFMATKRELTFLVSDFKRYLMHGLAILCEKAVGSQYKPHIPLVPRDALPRYYKGANISQGCRSSNRSSCRGLWGQTLPSLGPFSSQVGVPTPGSDPKPSGNSHKLFAKLPDRQQVPKIKVSPPLPETQRPRQGQIRLPMHP